MGSPIVRRAILTILILLLACGIACAASKDAHGSQMELPRVLLGLIVILIAAKIGGDIFVRLGQPAVLGELVFGIIVGNLYHLGFRGFDFIRTNESIKLLSEIGVMLLLFQVGMESNLARMMEVGLSSLVVATLGIIAPFFLGWGVASYFLPHESVYVHLFIGATLCATSVGITARVLLDLGRLQTPEARIILGAAVIDDVQGLVILAVVAGIIESVNAGTGAISSWSIFLIVLKATLFLFAALIIGKRISPLLFRLASRLKATDLLLTTALGICFGLAYLATQIQLAAIVGAFAAGLILEEVHWRSFRERGEHSVEELVRPIAAFLVPIFFVRMGSEVNLATFGSPSVLGFAAVLTLAAILGKQICGLGVMQRGLDRLSVGIGMIPRGEVGLIFAAIGAKLTMDGHPVVSQSTFSAVVIMVVVTTMITPPALKWSLTRSARVRPPQSP
ncbi:MAG: cation:proton antiporter [Armatimonadetes bacterium]|nr:cation:proton antiporter [Armatimonadota bacterium]